LLPTEANVVSIRADEVLLDVPGRSVDSGGKVYVEHADGRVLLLSELSQPVNHLGENYNVLAKRARVFVSPRIAQRLPDEWRIKTRPAIEELLHDSIGAVAGKSSEVR
jgi:hypothetical protein